MLALDSDLKRLFNLIDGDAPFSVPATINQSDLMQFLSFLKISNF